MPKVLNKIIEATKKEVSLRKKKIDLQRYYHRVLLKKTTLSHNFLTKISAIGLIRLGIIAEIKLASPSEGNIISEVELEDKIMDYLEAKVDAISVVTESKFFKGDLSLIGVVKFFTEVPILQKDFIIDPYQIYEAKDKGANALLLIARILSKQELKDFVDVCLEIGLDPVVEVNSIEDLENAVSTNAQIIAVNSRDLDTFEIDIERACRIMKQIPDHYLKLGFSGVNSKTEAKLYRASGASAVLIGTKLMKEKDIKSFLKEILKNG